MSGSVETVVWFHQYKLDALSSALAEQGATVEQRLEGALCDLYAELVPAGIREEIQARIDAETAAMEAELEKSRKYTALCVRENGADTFFQLSHGESFLNISKLLRDCLRQDRASGIVALEETFSGLTPVSADEYSKLMTRRLEEPNKVTGVFELDFDKREVSTVDFVHDWQTYTMKDVGAAVSFAFRKSGLGPIQQEARFENKLTSKAIPSAGHLSAKDIVLAEGICEMDGQRLNFYLDASFDVDAVFGTHVCTGENDDTLNVYADYDMAAGDVCDLLEVDLHRADGREESLEYRLNAVEKATLLRKMDDYCRQQTGQSLKDYSAGLMAEEEIALPAGPTL